MTVIELLEDIDEQLRAGQAEIEAYDEAHGVEHPVAAGTVPRRKGTDDLPQPSRELLAALDAHAAARARHDAELARLTSELEAQAVRLYVEHGLQGTELARRTGLSRKWLYAALARAGVEMGD